MSESSYKKIKKLTERQNAALKEAELLQQDALKLQKEIRKLRIIKNTGNGSFRYTILCYCGIPYKTRKDPDAVIREERPQCPQCKIRVETKK